MSGKGTSLLARQGFHSKQFRLAFILTVYLCVSSNLVILPMGYLSSDEIGTTMTVRW